MLLVRYDRTITSRQFNYLDNTTKKAFIPDKKAVDCLFSH